MDEQIFEAGADPEEIAGRLGLEIVQWFEGSLYARDADALYEIGQVSSQSDGGVPPDLRIQIRPAWSHDWSYVGEEYHSPREGANHAGLTTIEESPSGDVVALDGFGRKFRVSKTGNGPMASSSGWATAEEMRNWAPQHQPSKRTTT